MLTAATGAATYGLQRAAAVSQASADVAQGGGVDNEAWGGWGNREDYDKAVFLSEERRFLASAPPGREVVANGTRIAVRIARGLRILRGVDDRAAFSAMRQGEGVYSASEREARALAKRYSTSSGGGGDVVKDLPKQPGHHPHYHGLDADGNRLAGHSWFGRAKMALFVIVDANSDGTFDGFDVFEMANPFPVPLETPSQMY
jgi:hypothetical protein